MTALEFFKQELKRAQIILHGETHGEWGQPTIDARRLIRADLHQKLGELSGLDVQVLQDLSEPPRLDKWSVSISHTQGVGGWCAVRRPTQIGFDVETRVRIQMPLIQRVCTADEINQSPTPAFLWSAKEAFFKALEDDQPQVLSALQISGWQKLNDSSWSFTGIGPRNARGVVVDDFVHIWSACWIN